MGFIKAMIVLVLLIVAAIFLIRVIDEIKYSFAVDKELNENNATCYFDRGWFNLPLSKVCTYNNTLLIEKDEKIMIPRYGRNISIFPNGSWVESG